MCIRDRDKNGKLLAHENFYESSGGDVWLWGKGTGTIRLHKKEDGKMCIRDRDKRIYDQGIV